MRAVILKALDFTGRHRVGKRSCEQVPTAQSLNGTIVVATADAVSREWAPRWLSHGGLAVRLAGSTAELERLLQSEHASALLIDAGLTDEAGQPLYLDLRKRLGAAVPLTVLCSNNKEVRFAAEADVTDIARRPYDWQLIAQRVLRTLGAERQHRELTRVRAELDRVTSDAATTERLFAQARGHDRLTELPNRERFRSLLHAAIHLPTANARELAVLVIGIERFRRVNDAIGHELGNELLRQFGDRLKRCLQARELIGNGEGQTLTAFAARLGGVRFALAVSNAEPGRIEHIRQALGAAMSEPFEVGGHSIYLSISLGAAIFPRDCTEADGLLQCAENAMVEAKLDGSGFRMHRQPTDALSARRLKLDAMLREALRKNALTLAYQPILDTRAERIVAAEALLRWEHAAEGPISPAEFVPAAEESGLMVEIGRFVIREACRQLRAWLDQGAEPIRMAVNLSLCQLIRGNVVVDVERALGDYALDPRLLELEISERGVLNRHPQVINEVRRLKALGVRISIDDFGTGEASIAYLKDLPVDVIKIDRSYVSGAVTTGRDHAIASGIVALAQRLNASVVGEGVETPAQLAMLRDWGCEECQGFHFSAAIPPAEFSEKLIKS